MSRQAWRWYIALLLAFGAIVGLGGYARELSSHQIAGLLLRVEGWITGGLLATLLLTSLNPKTDNGKGAAGLLVLLVMVVSFLAACWVAYGACFGH